ncbi:MAG: hypothetical protein M1400_00100 [Patescibacteria group bacterium]|nr:hypothetical protein [Patescibacteria group bacterium]
MEKSFPPFEKEGGFPVERETKIKYIGSRDDFVAQMQAVKAELVEKTRMIDDLRFAAGENFKSGKKAIVAMEAFFGPDGEPETHTVVSALTLLGFNVNESADELELVSPSNMDNATVRIRNDGGTWIFTAKRRLEKLDENGYIEEKPEVEVELKDPALLRHFFENELGLELDSHRQKLRTSYRLKTGQLVELNESPAFETHNVPFWLEIEGRDLPDIEAAAKLLGFDRNHFFKGSDKKFLMKTGGLSEAETKNLLF